MTMVGYKPVSGYENYDICESCSLENGYLLFLKIFLIFFILKNIKFMFLGVFFYNFNVFY
jgi:hypothetical protein